MSDDKKKVKASDARNAMAERRAERRESRKNLTKFMVSSNLTPEISSYKQELEKELIAAKASARKAINNFLEISRELGDNEYMDGRIGKLEGQMEGVINRLNRIEEDIREITKKVDKQFIFMIAGFISTIGFLFLVMAKGFGWI